jgi:hypothetical protein
MVRVQQKARGRTTGSAENTRPSLREWFNGLFRALPGERIRFVAVVRGLRASISIPVGQSSLRGLGTSNGCQDHTASPYASAPFVCAPFDRSRVGPALRPRTRPTLPRPPHPAPNVRDDRDTPLSARRDKRIHKSDFSRSRSDLFFARALDTNSRRAPVEAGQEWRRFWGLMYDLVYDESYIQDRREP